MASWKQSQKKDYAPRTLEHLAELTATCTRLLSHELTVKFTADSEDSA